MAACSQDLTHCLSTAAACRPALCTCRPPDARACGTTAHDVRRSKLHPPAPYGLLPTAALTCAAPGARAGRGCRWSNELQSTRSATLSNCLLGGGCMQRWRPPALDGDNHCAARLLTVTIVLPATRLLPTAALDGSIMAAAMVLSTAVLTNACAACCVVGLVVDGATTRAAQLQSRRSATVPNNVDGRGARQQPHAVLGGNRRAVHLPAALNGGHALPSQRQPWLLSTAAAPCTSLPTYWPRDVHPATSIPRRPSPQRPSRDVLARDAPVDNACRPKPRWRRLRMRMPSMADALCSQRILKHAGATGLKQHHAAQGRRWQDGATTQDRLIWHLQGTVLDQQCSGTRLTSSAVAQALPQGKRCTLPVATGCTSAKARSRPHHSLACRAVIERCRCCAAKAAALATLDGSCDAALTRSRPAANALGRALDGRRVLTHADAGLERDRSASSGMEVEGDGRGWLGRRSMSCMPAASLVCGMESCTAAAASMAAAWRRAASRWAEVEVVTRDGGPPRARAPCVDPARGARASHVLPAARLHAARLCLSSSHHARLTPRSPHHGTQYRPVPAAAPAAALALALARASWLVVCGGGCGCCCGGCVGRRHWLCPACRARSARRIA